IVTPTGASSYTGLAIASLGGHSYLYAPNFRTGAVDVFKGDTAAPNLTGRFADPNLPSGYAPFNIQTLGGRIFIAYALTMAGSNLPQFGAGLGFVDLFDLNGNLIQRMVSQAQLNAPFGLALAPSDFGPFKAGDLLVGNRGDGRINVFDPTGTFV